MTIDTNELRQKLSSADTVDIDIVIGLLEGVPKC